LASKALAADEPGAFDAREWLRKLVVGKPVRFETRKQGGTAGDRVYGWLFLPAVPAEGGEEVSLAVECVRHGWATPKAVSHPSTSAGEKKSEGGTGGVVGSGGGTDEEEYESQLLAAYQEARAAKRGIHAERPLVRKPRNAGDDFAVLALVEATQKLCSGGRVRCVVEYIFDGGRVRGQVVDPQLADYLHASFTLVVAGIACPRVGNPRADPPIAPEPCGEEARQFVTARLMQRELDVSLYGVDKSGQLAVGTIHHPAGNIAVELLKNGLARMTDWSVRLMPAGEVPALRVAENAAKRSRVRIWHSYAAPVLQSASEVSGTVIEVLSGDTLLLLPDGKNYATDTDLVKLSLASLRAPRAGSERTGRADEPYSSESKEMLRSMTVGKPVKVCVHYEREIPVQPGVNEPRPFGTVSCGKHSDVAEVLVSEGLALTQRHRDDDEKSPRYDELRAAEAAAKAAKKGVHKEGEYKTGMINDLTDQRKAKAYSGSLMRAGKLKGIVEFVFNGALFKILIPSENCHVRFSPNFVRCPQPSPSPGSKQQSRAAEPFGDEAKIHARLHVLQRHVELVCTGVTNSGIIVGSMHVGFGNKRSDYAIELLGAGLATVDARKMELGEVPKYLLDAQSAAQQNRVGLWSITKLGEKTAAVKVSTEKLGDKTATVRLSEVRSGNHFFFHVVNDDSVKVIEESMKLFTQNNGTVGAPCDAKVGKVVAALFNDGSGKSWYRARIVEKKTPAKVQVLFIDHGNLATLPVASHLRPLDMSLGPERIPAVAKEAVLALTSTRPLDTDEGLEAAKYFQRTCWGKDLIAHIFAPDDTGRLPVSLTLVGQDEPMNVQLVSEGLARVPTATAVEKLASRMSNTNAIMSLAAALNVAQETARKSRAGMWRYGDIGEDDPDEN
jgi:staphylococcal nuclease domain-containing protein 1